MTAAAKFPRKLSLRPKNILQLCSCGLLLKACLSLLFFFFFLVFLSIWGLGYKGREVVQLPLTGSCYWMSANGSL